MTVHVSPRLRAGTAALATGLLLAVVPGVATPQAALAATPTALSLRADHSTYVAGSTISLLAHLNVAKKSIIFYEAYRGRSAHEIFRGATDARGNLAIHGKVSYSSVYSVVFPGDTSYASSTSNRVSTKVRVAISIKAAGGAKRKGYRLYRQSKKGYVATAVGPSKTGRRVLFRLQTRKNGHWHTIDKRRYKLRKGSAVEITYRGKAGKRYRVRAEYAGDSLNAKNHTKWIYSRFRR